MRKTNGNYAKEVFQYENDGEINECLIKLYLLLSAGSNNPNLKMYEGQFIRAYKKLTDEKKEIVKNNFIKALKKQNELNVKGEMKL